MCASHKEARFTQYRGYISTDAKTILEEDMSVEDAKTRCAALPECKGFTYPGMVHACMFSHDIKYCTCACEP